MAPQTVSLPAVILAAGMSTRMGTPKLALPWADTTVLGHVIDTYALAEVSPIVIVTGAESETIRRAAGGRDVLFVQNADYAAGEMLSSIQVGLRFLLGADWPACLIAPGDLPMLQSETIAAVCAPGITACSLTVPSFNNRRGHPVLIGRDYWPEILSLTGDKTLRDFFICRSGTIHYVVVEDAGIRQDMDTPGEYHTLKPPEDRLN